MPKKDQTPQGGRLTTKGLQKIVNAQYAATRKQQAAIGKEISRQTGGRLHVIDPTGKGKLVLPKGMKRQTRSLGLNRGLTPGRQRKNGE